MQELHQRIENGEIGDIILLRGYRMHGPVASCFSTKWPGDPSELLWQIQRFHSFLWASGGLYNDFYIHHIDHLCWMKNAWPIKAQALGGRHYKSDADGQPYVDQNFDTYSVEYTFEDGARMIMDGRCMNGCNDIYASYAQGSKGLAIVANHGDCGAAVNDFQGPECRSARSMLWTSKDIPGQEDPYQNEWNDLLDAIRNDKPYNEVERGVKASLVTQHGPHGRPHRPGNCLRRHAQLRARVRARRGQADDELSRPGTGRKRWQVSRPDAGHHQGAGILTEPEGYGGWAFLSSLSFWDSGLAA